MSTGEASTVPSRLQVFIVDDDRSFGRSLARLLHARGLKSHYFSSGRAFLASGCLDQQDAIAVVDINMPELDGFGVIGKMRHDGCYMPVIVVTGQPIQQAEHQAREHGAAGFLHKPFGEEQLMELIAGQTVGAKE
jgi:FixJ family two-component response regulator